jgi:hypothetical protein
MLRSQHLNTGSASSGDGTNPGGGEVYVRDIDNAQLDQAYRDTVAYWDRRMHTLEAFNGSYFFKLPNETQSGGALVGLRMEAASSGTGGSGGGTVAGAGGTLAIAYQSGQLVFLDRAYAALAESVYGALRLCRRRPEPLRRASRHQRLCRRPRQGRLACAERQCLRFAPARPASPLQERHHQMPSQLPRLVPYPRPVSSFPPGSCIVAGIGHQAVTASSGFAK